MGTISIRTSRVGFFNGKNRPYGTINHTVRYANGNGSRAPNYAVLVITAVDGRQKTVRPTSFVWGDNATVTFSQEIDLSVFTNCRACSWAGATYVVRLSYTERQFGSIDFTRLESGTVVFSGATGCADCSGGPFTNGSISDNGDGWNFEEIASELNGTSGGTEGSGGGEGGGNEGGGSESGSGPTINYGPADIGDSLPPLPREPDAPCLPAQYSPPHPKELSRVRIRDR